MTALFDLAAAHTDPLWFALGATLLAATAWIALPLAWQRWRGR